MEEILHWVGFMPFYMRKRKGTQLPPQHKNTMRHQESTLLTGFTGTWLYLSVSNNYKTSLSLFINDFIYGILLEQSKWIIIELCIFKPIFIYCINYSFVFVLRVIYIPIFFKEKKGKAPINFKNTLSNMNKLFQWYFRLPL